MLEQWILAMVVVYTLVYPESTESSIVCEDEKICGCLKKEEDMQIKRVYKNAMAIIPCPNLEDNEELISASLHKGEMMLHFTDMKNKSCGQFNVSVQNYSVSYKIQETESNNTGIYSCTIQTQTRKKKSNTILLIEDAQQPTVPTKASPPCPSLWTLILYIAIGVIFLYDLVITVVCCVHKCKVKNKEPPENCYMNTRHARFRRR